MQLAFDTDTLQCQPPRVVCPQCQNDKTGPITGVDLMDCTGAGLNEEEIRHVHSSHPYASVNSDSDSDDAGQ